MLDLKTKINITKKIELVNLAGDESLINFETGNYYELKGSASAIWEYIKNEMIIAELVDAVLKDFDIDADTCLSEISSFLSKLAEQDFIELQT